MASKMIYANDLCSVYHSSKVSVLVPTDLDMPDGKAVEQARNLNLDTPDRVTRLESISHEARSRRDRAILLAMLFDKVGLFEFRHDDVTRQAPETSRIPVQVAVSGRPAMACYLAAHGLSNSDIGELLDVGDRTVSQYISDFQKGER